MAQSGPIVIDNSSAWRMDPNVPLVIPEINMEACKGKKLIANPNCTTAIALMALYPLHKAFGVKKCIVSTYQARGTTKCFEVGRAPERGGGLLGKVFFGRGEGRG